MIDDLIDEMASTAAACRRLVLEAEVGLGARPHAPCHAQPAYTASKRRSGRAAAGLALTHMREFDHTV